LSQSFQSVPRTKGKSSLLPDEIDTIFVRDFEAFLRSLGLNSNSAKKYIAVFRKVFNEGKILNLIKTNNDPFIAFKATRTPTQKDYLTKLEVELIMNADLNNNPVLLKTRRQFLFQLFSQGLRVSDLMTLKWNNYKSGELNFTQFKTKTPHRVMLNKHSLRILAEQIPGCIEGLLQKRLEGEIGGKKLIYNYDEWLNAYKVFSKARLTQIVNGDQRAIDEVEAFKNQIDRIDMWYQYELNNTLTDFSMKNPSKFIFDMLPSEQFKGITFNETTSIPPHLYKLLSSKTAIYNTHLKKLQKAVGLNKVFTSHLMRTTFASLLIDETEQDFFTVSKLLGHRRVSTTESYISNTLRKRNDVASNMFAGMFQ
jgi:integrase/recombinase XerD